MTRPAFCAFLSASKILETIKLQLWFANCYLQCGRTLFALTGLVCKRINFHGHSFPRFRVRGLYSCRSKAVITKMYSNFCQRPSLQLAFLHLRRSKKGLPLFDCTYVDKPEMLCRVTEAEKNKLMIGKQPNRMYDLSAWDHTEATLSIHAETPSGILLEATLFQSTRSIRLALYCQHLQESISRSAECFVCAGKHRRKHDRSTVALLIWSI